MPLPRRGTQLIGRKVVPIDEAPSKQKKLEGILGGAREASNAADLALEQAEDARRAALAAANDAREAVKAIEDTLTANGEQLALKGSEILTKGSATAELALSAARRAEAAQGTVITLSSERISAMEEMLRVGQSVRDDTQRIVKGLVGIRYITFLEEQDKVFLVIVMTDGRVLRKNIRGPRGYGSAGPRGAPGKDGVSGLTEEQVLALIEAAGLQDNTLVNVTYTSDTDDRPSRIVRDDSEDRFDWGTGEGGTYQYKGSAAKDASTAAAVWAVFRSTLDAQGRVSTREKRENVAWDDRAVGW